jgi:hypothetical protein
VSGFTDRLRRTQRREEEIRASERKKIADELFRRADGIDQYLAGRDHWGHLTETDQQKYTLISVTLWNTALSILKPETVIIHDHYPA